MTEPVEHGIQTIDTGFGGANFDAAYLIVDEQRGAFVDCGTSLSVPHMLAALTHGGLTPAQVEWLILTHVHLDHAGGAGALLQHLPNARVLVHPRGAPHLIDPARLIAGATAVYGAEALARSYGEILPVPAERVVQAPDGHTLLLGTRALQCIDTPGHARHHLCLWDARSRSWFTGDTFGLSYRELDGPDGPFILPTTSPVQFEPEALKASIALLLSYRPQAMYLTHYDRIGEVEKLAADLIEQIDAMVLIARDCDAATADIDGRHARLRAALSGLYLRRARAQAVPLDDAGVLRTIGMDIELNAQGLACWLDRDRR